MTGRHAIQAERRRAMLARRIARANGDPRRIAWALTDYLKAAIVNADPAQARALADALAEHVPAIVDRAEEART